MLVCCCILVTEYQEKLHFGIQQGNRIYACEYFVYSSKKEEKTSGDTLVMNKISMLALLSRSEGHDKASQTHRVDKKPLNLWVDIGLTLKRFTPEQNGQIDRNKR